MNPPEKYRNEDIVQVIQAFVYQNTHRNFTIKMIERVRLSKGEFSISVPSVT
jgi:hypothetical protein